MEGLEIRELLDAGFAGQGSSALPSDLARFGNDLAMAPITLLNAVQPSSTNTPTAAYLASQGSKEANLLVQDWQAVLRDEYEVLSHSPLFQAIEQADNRVVQIVDAALGLLDPPFVKPNGGVGSPTTAPSPPAATNPTLGSTTQAPASGKSGSSPQGQPPMSPFLVTHLPGVTVSDGSNLCNCGCPNQSGDLMQSGANTAAPAPGASTNAPVRYADGVVTIAETDLHSDGFGFPWGQTRSWTNGPGYATGSDNGNGWVDTYTPHLIEDGFSTDTLIFIANGNTAYYYDLVNGVYQPRINDGSQLVYNSNNDTYTLTDTKGDQTVLDGFGTSWLTAQKGQFASFTDPYSGPRKLDHQLSYCGGPGKG